MSRGAKLAIPIPGLLVIALLLQLSIGRSSDVRHQPIVPADAIEAAPSSL
jgi:hypothetical protein